MARSLFDIPPRLRNLDNCHDFKVWLSRLPVESQVKRRLIKIWSDHTGLKFLHLDYRDAGVKV